MVSKLAEYLRGADGTACSIAAALRCGGRAYAPIHMCVTWPSACLNGKMKVDWLSYVVDELDGL
jgi:hypothetical protein